MNGKITASVQTNTSPNLRGGLVEAGGGGGGLINYLEKMMLSVLHRELEHEVEKLNYKKVRGHVAEDQKQMRNSSW